MDSEVQTHITPSRMTQPQFGWTAAMFVTRWASYVTLRRIPRPPPAEHSKHIRTSFKAP